MIVFIKTFSYWLPILLILGGIVGCSARYPQKLEKTPSPVSISDGLSLEDAIKSYEALTTVYRKRKPYLSHLHWQKPIVPVIITTKLDEDDAFRPDFKAGFDEISQISGLTVTWNNYYQFEPNFFFLYLNRRQLKQINQTLDISDTPQHCSKPKQTFSETGQKDIQRLCVSLTGNYSSNPEFSKLLDWIELVETLAENEDENGAMKTFKNENLCGVFSASHFKDHHAIDTVIGILPKDLPINLKRRCFKSILMRSMGLNNGYYQSPLHTYNHKPLRNSVMGLYPDIYDKRLLKLGSSILNQGQAIKNFTDLDRFLITLHYHNQRQKIQDYNALSSFAKDIGHIFLYRSESVPLVKK